MTSCAYLEHFDDGRIYIVGSLDFDSVVILLQHGKQYIHKLEKICFDLAKVSHANSAGVGLLVNLLRFAQHNMKKVCFANIPAQVLDIIRVSGLTHILSIGVDNAGSDYPSTD